MILEGLNGPLGVDRVIRPANKLRFCKNRNKTMENTEYKTSDVVIIFFFLLAIVLVDIYDEFVGNNKEIP